MMLLLIMLVLLTSELPDPGRLTTAGLASLLGGFVGGCIGRLRHRSRERIRDLTLDGGYVGFGVGFIGWLIAIAIDRL
jgi:hypothetical protein